MMRRALALSLAEREREVKRNKERPEMIFGRHRQSEKSAIVGFWPGFTDDDDVAVTGATAKTDETSDCQSSSSSSVG